MTLPRARLLRAALAASLLVLALPFLGCEPLDLGDDAVAVSIILD
jgi:hypothetical protein